MRAGNRYKRGRRQLAQRLRAIEIGTIPNGRLNRLGTSACCRGPGEHRADEGFQKPFTRIRKAETGVFGLTGCRGRVRPEILHDFWLVRLPLERHLPRVDAVHAAARRRQPDRARDAPEPRAVSRRGHRGASEDRGGSRLRAAAPGSDLQPSWRVRVFTACRREPRSRSGVGLPFGGRPRAARPRRGRR